MIDFHCHLDLYPDPIAIAEEIQHRKVGVLSVTNTPSAWKGTSGLAVGRSSIKTALGFHPQLARQRKRELALFEEFLPETRFVGEVGLDGSPENRNSWDDQIEVFDFVLNACANAGGKILSVHSRRAVAAVLDRLENEPNAGAAILHWFSGTKAELRRAITNGCWFSVGPVMLAGAKGQALVAEIPRDRILLETDGPFTEVGGRPLNPWNINLATDRLAAVWDIGSDEVANILRRNETTILR